MEKDLIRAACLGDFDKVARLLDDGANVNARSDDLGVLRCTTPLLVKILI
jgi:hypothetical protein